MSAPFKVSRNVRFVIDVVNPDRFGLTTRRTNYEIAVSDFDVTGYGWRFFATRSGVEIMVYDERPDRREDRHYGRVIEEQPYICWTLQEALDNTEELYQGILQAGVALTDAAAEVHAQLSGLIFFVSSSTAPIQWRRPLPPRRRRKTVTQKILNGGGDMTIRQEFDSTAGGVPAPTEDR